MDSDESLEINRRIRVFFDELAERWDVTVCPQHAERLAAIIQRLSIPPRARILDVGCGTGVLWPFLTLDGALGRFVVAIDLSFEMLRIGAGRMRAPSSSVLRVQADASVPPFGDNVFDWIICNSVFPHFLDQQACVNQLAHALTATGRFVVCHSQSREAINAHHRSHGGLVGGHELPDARTMRRIMEQAGLDIALHEDADDHYLVLAVKNATG